MQAIEIFRPGTHTAANGQTLHYTDADLAATAGAYDAALHEAPIVVGHPKTDAPAYGWVKGVSFADGKLVVEPDQLDPEFAEMVKNGRFKKVSASFYPPEAKSNPAPGKWYLRHVGFLGAQPPAVKGLKPVAFHDDDTDIVTFGESFDRSTAGLFRRIREFFISKFGEEDADRVLPGWEIDHLQNSAGQRDELKPQFTEPEPKPAPKPKPDTKPDPEKEPDMDPNKDADFAEREAALKSDEDKIKAEREKLDKEATEFAEKKAAARREADAAWLDGLIEAGRVAPGHKDGLVAFMAGLDDEDEAVSFGEEGKETKATAHGFFRAFLEQMPKGIDFTERAGETGNELDTSNSDDIAAAAVIYQEEMKAKGVNVATEVAVRHVMKGADA